MIYNLELRTILTQQPEVSFFFLIAHCFGDVRSHEHPCRALCLILVVGSYKPVGQAVVYVLCVVQAGKCETEVTEMHPL